MSASLLSSDLYKEGSSQSKMNDGFLHPTHLQSD